MGLRLRERAVRKRRRIGLKMRLSGCVKGISGTVRRREEGDRDRVMSRRN